MRAHSLEVVDPGNHSLSRHHPCTPHLPMNHAHYQLSHSVALRLLAIVGDRDVVGFPRLECISRLAEHKGRVVYDESKCCEVVINVSERNRDGMSGSDYEWPLWFGGKAVAN